STPSARASASATTDSVYASVLKPLVTACSLRRPRAMLADNAVGAASTREYGRMAISVTGCGSSGGAIPGAPTPRVIVRRTAAFLTSAAQASATAAVTVAGSS